MKTSKIEKIFVAIVAIIAMFIAVSVKDGSEGEIVIRAINSIIFVCSTIFYNRIDKEDEQ